MNENNQLSRINNFIERYVQSRSDSDGCLLMEEDLELIGGKKKRKLTRNPGNCTNDTIGRCDINTGDCTNYGLTCMNCQNDGECKNLYKR